MCLRNLRVYNGCHGSNISFEYNRSKKVIEENIKIRWTVFYCNLGYKQLGNEGCGLFWFEGGHCFVEPQNKTTPAEK